MKKKDHDIIAETNYECEHNEIVGGKIKSKSKKHKRINSRQLLLSAKKIFNT